MCQLCGLPVNVPCNCQQTEPFCTPCDTTKKCSVELDASCVIYHIDGASDSPSRLTCLNLPNLTSVETILETIDQYICNNANVPITVIETFTAKMTATGPARHTLKTDVKVSEDGGNIIEVRPDGLFVPTPPDPPAETFKVKVDAGDTPDYLVNQVTGGNSGFLTINVADTSGVLHITPAIDGPTFCTTVSGCVDYKVKVDSGDTPDYLVNQIQGATADFLTINVVNTSGTLVITPVLDLDGLCEAINNCKCSQSVTNLMKTFSPACPDGYTLNDAANACISVVTTPPTISDTIVTACPAFRNEYSANGSLIYKDGYTTSGTGHGVNLTADVGAGHIVSMTTANVWKSDNITGNDNGPANRVGIWDCEGSQGTDEDPQVLGFVVPINVTSTKTYYVGVAADNDYKIQVNGALIVDSSLTDGSYWGVGEFSKFRWWHIYPVVLTSGLNYLSIYASDTGVDAVLAAEVYDATIPQLQAALLKTAYTSSPSTFPYDQNPYSNLNLIFTTRCARQEDSTFVIGNATCPDSSWVLDTSSGTPIPPCQGINDTPSEWLCTKTLVSAFDGYNVVLVWDRLTQAISYDVQQKLSSQDSSFYATSTGSPVMNPVSGDTVELDISGLPSNAMDFRVRPFYGNCYGPWQETS